MNKISTKAVLLYYRDPCMINIPFSLLMGVLAGREFLTGFGISLSTGGMLLAVYFYETNYKENYYFYFNKGLSKPKLWAACSLLNILIMLVLLALPYGYE